MFEWKSLTVEQHCDTSDLGLNFLWGNVFYYNLTATQRLNLGNNLQHHEGWSKPLFYRNDVWIPFTWEIIEMLSALYLWPYRAWEWQLSVQTYPWCCWHCSLEQTRHDPALQTSYIYSDYQPHFLVLRRDGILNILFVVHTKTIELAQNLHSLGHIPFSGSRETFYKRYNV